MAAGLCPCGYAGECTGSDLVETGAAVDGSIVPRREWHDGLPPTGPADRGMKLAWALTGAGTLGHGSTGWAALRVVGQAFRREEGLLAGREDELLATITAGQTTVLVHPLQTLLGSDAIDGRAQACLLTGPVRTY